MPIGAYDLVVIGASELALAIARRAIQSRKRLALICPNLAQLEIREFLAQSPNFDEIAEKLACLQADGVDVIHGVPRFGDRLTTKNTCHINGRSIHSRRWVLAGTVAERPQIMGLGDINYLTYDHLLAHIPQVQHLTILGGQALDCAIAQKLQGLGIKVQIITPDRLLPDFDPALAQIIQGELEAMGIEIWSNTIVTAITEQKIWINPHPIARPAEHQVLVPIFSDLLDLELPANLEYAEDIDLVLPMGFKFLNWLAIAPTQLPIHICHTKPPAISLGITEPDARFGQRLKVIEGCHRGLFYKILARPSRTIIGAHLHGAGALEVAAAMAIIMSKRLKIHKLPAIASVLAEIAAQL